MARLLHVLAAQVRPVSFDPEETLAKFEREVGLFAKYFPDASMYVFPELYLAASDPFVTAAKPHGFNPHVAERLPGRLSKRVGEIAAEAGRWIVAGSVIEETDDGLYNTAMVFDPSGELVTTYRKIFTWQPFESNRCGTEPCVFDVPGVGRFGLMICYDGWFPEAVRALSLAGAEVILQPTLTTTCDRDDEVVIARANAMMNQVFLVNVNAATTVGGGQSLIVDPEGRVLAHGGQNEEFLTQVIDLDTVGTVRERGHRGLNRVMQRLESAPPSIFRQYERFLDRG